MITYRSGDIFFNSYAEAVVCPVNCVGVMGAGMARAMRALSSHTDYLYRQLCTQGVLRLGAPCVVEPEDFNKLVVLFPTKHHYHDRSNLMAIDKGLYHLVHLADSGYFSSAAVPMLGCGLGGLDFRRQVQPLMAYHLEHTDAVFEVFI